MRRAAKVDATQAAIVSGGKIMELKSVMAPLGGALTEIHEGPEPVDKLAASIELYKRLDRAEEDAQRYRWLRDSGQLDPALTTPKLAYAFARYCGGMLDSAIDAARDESEGEPK